MTTAIKLFSELRSLREHRVLIPTSRDFLCDLRVISNETFYRTIVFTGLTNNY